MHTNFGYLNQGNPLNIGENEAQACVNCGLERGWIEYKEYHTNDEEPNISAKIGIREIYLENGEIKNKYNGTELGFGLTLKSFLKDPSQKNLFKTLFTEIYWDRSLASKKITSGNIAVDSLAIAPSEESPYYVNMIKKEFGVLKYKINFLKKKYLFISEVFVEEGSPIVLPDANLYSKNDYFVYQITSASTGVPIDRKVFILVEDNNEGVISKRWEERENENFFNSSGQQVSVYIGSIYETVTEDLINKNVFGLELKEDFSSPFWVKFQKSYYTLNREGSSWYINFKEDAPLWGQFFHLLVQVVSDTYLKWFNVDIDTSDKVFYAATYGKEESFYDSNNVLQKTYAESEPYYFSTNDINVENESDYLLSKKLPYVVYIYPPEADMYVNNQLPNLSESLYINIYRIPVGGSEYLFANKIKENVRYITDKKKDIDLGGILETVGNSGTVLESSNVSSIVLHKDMLFASIDNILWFSKQGILDQFPAKNFFVFQDNITGLVQYNSNLLVLTEKENYMLYGMDNQGFLVAKVDFKNYDNINHTGRALYDHVYTLNLTESGLQVSKINSQYGYDIGYKVKQFLNENSFSSQLKNRVQENRFYVVALSRAALVYDVMRSGFIISENLLEPSHPYLGEECFFRYRTKDYMQNGKASSFSQSNKALVVRAKGKIKIRAYGNDEIILEDEIDFGDTPQTISDISMKPDIYSTFSVEFLGKEQDSIVYGWDICNG